VGGIWAASARLSLSIACPFIGGGFCGSVGVDMLAVNEAKGGLKRQGPLVSFHVARRQLRAASVDARRASAWPIT